MLRFPIVYFRNFGEGACHGKVDGVAAVLPVCAMNQLFLIAV